MQKIMVLFNAVVLCLALLVQSFSNALAEEDRIDIEANDTTPIVNPLQFALGNDEYEKAMESNEYFYSGNLKCRLCHRDFFIGRKKDLHAHTFQNSIESVYYEEPRCLTCHTTGYGVQTGFVSLKETPKLINIQCEGCHGPGSKHNELGENGGFLAGTDRPEILKKMCQACHNSRWNNSFKDVDAAYESYKEAEAKAAGN